MKKSQYNQIIVNLVAERMHYENTAAEAIQSNKQIASELYGKQHQFDMQGNATERLLKETTMLRTTIGDLNTQNSVFKSKHNELTEYISDALSIKADAENEEVLRLRRVLVVIHEKLKSEIL